MVEPKLQIVLQRRDCTCNVARFYVLTIEPSLFGDTALVRAWGRMGSFGRQRLDLYGSAGEAGEALETAVGVYCVPALDRYPASANAIATSPRVRWWPLTG